MRALLIIVVAALLAAAPAFASEERPTLRELEGEIVCPTCRTTLDMSNAPIAQRMKAYIARRIDEGATKTQIKNELVAEFGRGVLAAPPKKGFDLLAWVLPLAGVLLGAAVVGVLAWRWTRERGEEAAAPLDPELERRLDEELLHFSE